jgi:hypothetical protein
MERLVTMEGLDTHRWFVRRGSNLIADKSDVIWEHKVKRSLSFQHLKLPVVQQSGCFMPRES